MAICAACGKPITMEQGSYYAKSPLDDIGNTYHSGCGDPLGIKAAVAAEREACAKVATEFYVESGVALDIAAAIRARV